MQKSKKLFTEAKKVIPDGYRALKEGQANILYIDSKHNRDAENMINVKGKGKRQANEVN